MGTLIGMILRSDPRVVLQYRRVEPVPTAPAPDPPARRTDREVGSNLGTTAVSFES